jgi:hypothetical protein
MLTDLRLQKYLLGQLSAKEEKELEALLEKNPDLKRRLGELEERGLVTRPMWERAHLERKSRRGSKVRYTTILPALLILLLVLILASHWFSRPGRNSTFIRTGGNGVAVELLYRSAQGWRYLDAGFKPGDSLTFSVRDDGKYSIRIFGIYPGAPNPLAEEIWKSPQGARYGSRDAEPIFSSLPPPSPIQTQRDSKTLPRFLVVVYDTGSMESLALEDLPALLRDGGGGGHIPAFHYQIFNVPTVDSNR